MRALLRRQELIQLLSPAGTCGKCGKTKDLEVHHIDGRSWDVTKVNRWTRVARYWKEYQAGVRLAAFCKRCNIKAEAERWQAAQKAKAK